MDAVFWMVGDWAWRGDRMREAVRALPATQAARARGAAPQGPGTIERSGHETVALALALDEVSARAR